MAKLLTINLSDELEQALNSQAASSNQSLEEVILQLLSQQLPLVSPSQTASNEPILELIGAIYLEDIHNLGEKHDEYI